MESNFTVDINSLDEKSALEKLRKEKLLGHIMRYRAHWIKEGKKPSTYFCNLELRNYIKKQQVEDIGMVY